MELPISGAKQLWIPILVTTTVQLMGPGKLCDLLHLRLLLYKMGMMFLSWGCLAQGRYLRNVVSCSSISLHLPPNSIHTQEKLLTLEHEEVFFMSLLPFSFSHTEAKLQQHVFSSPLHLSPQPLSPAISCQVTRREQKSRGNRPSSSQRGGR